MIEGVFQLPPGGFAQQPPEWQRMFRENARTLPLAFAAPPAPSTPCDTLKTIKKPTLIVSGAQTSGFFPLIDEALAKCISGAKELTLPNVNHDGPARDPKAFSRAILEFLSKQAGSRG
jgi:pimeloyl-ACP methyl ester carboxylesterase